MVAQLPTMAPMAGAGVDSEVDREREWWSCGLMGEVSLRDFYCVEGVLIYHHIHTIRLPGAWHTLTSLVCRSLPQLMKPTLYTRHVKEMGEK